MPGWGSGSSTRSTRRPAFDQEGRRYLLTDTVGFIRKLPHQLVEAFKATLEETVLADLILHVVDGSDSEADRTDSITAAASVLAEIGADAAPRLLVMNKIDLLDDAEPRAGAAPSRRRARLRGDGEGLDALRSRIADAIRQGLTAVELLVPLTPVSVF